MLPYRPNIPSDLPPALEKRLKLIEALARHTAQDHRAASANARSGPTIRETYPELAALWQWLILKYSPDQPRVPAGSRDGGQWTKGEGASADTPPSRPAKPGVQSASAIGIFSPNAVTHNEKVDRTSHLLLGIAAEVADAFGPIGTLSPSQFGTKLHTLFAAAVRAAGIPGVEVEQTFPGGPYGSKDSIRTDVILRDESGKIIAIYDLKTGGASLEPRRVRELRAKTGTTPQTYVFQIRAHDVTLKYRRIERNVSLTGSRKC